MSTRWGFAGQNALVTGAASGIGAATAAALHAAGLTVLLVDRDARAGEAVRAGLGERARFHQADISDQDQAERAVDALCGGEPLSYLAHCAGIHQQAGVAELTDGDWSRMLAVNLTGAFHVARACARRMRDAPSPAIVNVTSIEAVRVVALVNPHATPHYAASKAGLGMLTRSLAHEFAPEIRVNAVAPGPVDTPMIRDDRASSPVIAPALAAHLLIKRYARPAEVADAICFLLSDAASFITATTLTVDGGFTAL